eukprot:3870846-Rhodomonas_salina.1
MEQVPPPMKLLYLPTLLGTDLGVRDAHTLRACCTLLCDPNSPTISFQHFSVRTTALRPYNMPLHSSVQIATLRPYGMLLRSAVLSSGYGRAVC